MVDLFGTFDADVHPDNCLVYGDLRHASFQEDAKQLHRDWVSVLPEVAGRYDKRQLSLNFESASSGK